MEGFSLQSTASRAQATPHFNARVAPRGLAARAHRTPINQQPTLASQGLKWLGIPDSRAPWCRARALTAQQATQPPRGKSDACADTFVSKH